MPPTSLEHLFFNNHDCPSLQFKLFQAVSNVFLLLLARHGSEANGNACTLTPLALLTLLAGRDALAITDGFAIAGRLVKAEGMVTADGLVNVADLVIAVEVAVGEKAGLAGSMGRDVATLGATTEGLGVVTHVCEVVKLSDKDGFRSVGG